ncbi:MAG: sigma-70 family RNA polymerase sigma factor [Candidatus Velthaea sp.]|jgi:RNA polymerase sigma-B factor
MIVDTPLSAYLADPTEFNRDALVAAHYGMCRRGARKFRRAGTDLADLEQVAVLGLLKAIRYFRTELQTPFEAYAWIMVVGELMHYVRDFERSVRLPRRIRSRERELRAASEQLAVNLGRYPSSVELATHLGLPLRELDEIRRLEGGVMSLDAATVHVATQKLEDELLLRMAVEALPERERRIIRGTFEEGLTQSELGLRLGVTQSHVSKLLARALSRLHHAVA